MGIYRNVLICFHAERKKNPENCSGKYGFGNVKGKSTNYWKLISSNPESKFLTCQALIELFPNALALTLSHSIHDNN